MSRDVLQIQYSKVLKRHLKNAVHYMFTLAQPMDRGAAILDNLNDRLILALPLPRNIMIDCLAVDDVKDSEK